MSPSDLRQVVLGQLRTSGAASPRQLVKAVEDAHGVAPHDVRDVLWRMLDEGSVLLNADAHLTAR